MTASNGQTHLFKREGRRFAKVGRKELAKLARGDSGQPQKVTPRIVQSVSDIQRSSTAGFMRYLVNSDIAYREARQYQRQMRRDPDIQGPLFQRQYAVSQLEWDIVPEDPEDETQVEQAAEIKMAIQTNMRKWQDFIRCLSEAIWYGPAAVEVVYAVVDGKVAPVDWIPFNSDSLAWMNDGTLGMRVGLSFDGEKTIGPEGQIHTFTIKERRRVVLHVFQREAPDYDVDREARYWYSGRGLRDVVYWTWKMKQVAMSNWMLFIERYGPGIPVGYYEDGNDEAKSEMVEILQNLMADRAVVMPRRAGVSQAEQTSGLEILEVPTNNSKVFPDLIEGYLAGQIKELIIGQTATTEATATGLGSDVGTRHAETFNRIIKRDALSLEDTLTHELVHEISLMRYGATPYKPRFTFSVEKVDSQEFMEGVEKYIGIGGTVADRQVRDVLGFDEPEEGDTILQQQQMMDPFTDSLFGDDVSEETERFSEVLR